MKNLNKIRLMNLIQNILIFVLIVLISFMIYTVNSIQGNARVVNYAGIVRGATQRLVKLEISNQPNNSLIADLDKIISSLKNGGGKYKLNKLTDKVYLDSLSVQEGMWNELKQEIYKTRDIGTKSDRILALSEEYFDRANYTVTAAEKYSEKKSSSLQLLEIMLIINIIFIVALLINKTILMVLLNKKNKELNSMAYVDANTGLPNKIRCDKLLLENGILGDESGVACIMFDLNNLKIVNDTFGHKAGDALILNFANIIRRTAPEEVFVGRYGGDEFIGVLFNTSEPEVKKVLDDIEINIQKFNDDKHGALISYAVGYEMSSGYKECTLQILLDKADKKMYIDKKRKKGNMTAGTE